MHILALALLSILAGTLLLAKVKKEALGKFFTYISWFFLVVGFILFLGCIAGGICKLAHHCKPGTPFSGREMMMRDGRPDMPGEKCCPPGKDMQCPEGKGISCPEHRGMDGCYKEGMGTKSDSLGKPCPKQVKVIIEDKTVTKTTK